MLLRLSALLLGHARQLQQGERQRTSVQCAHAGLRPPPASQVQTVEQGTDERLRGYGLGRPGQGCARKGPHPQPLLTSPAFCLAASKVSAALSRAEAAASEI